MIQQLLPMVVPLECNWMIPGGRGGEVFGDCRQDVDVVESHPGTKQDSSSHWYAGQVDDKYLNKCRWSHCYACQSWCTHALMFFLSFSLLIQALYIDLYIKQQYEPWKFFIYCAEWFHRWLSESWRRGWHCQSHRSDHRERRVMGSGEEKTFGTLCYSFLCLKTTWSDKGGLLRRLASTKPHLFLLQLAEQVIKMVSKQTVEDTLTHFSRTLDPEWRESHPGEIKMFDQV